MKRFLDANLIARVRPVRPLAMKRFTDANVLFTGASGGLGCDIADRASARFAQLTVAP